MNLSIRALLVVSLALSVPVVACSDDGEVPPDSLSGQGGATTTAAGGSGLGGATTTGAGGQGGTTTPTGGGGHGGQATTGTGGQGGAGGGKGGAGGSGGSGGSAPCNWQANANPCGAGFYCDGCAGVCAPNPMQGSETAAKSLVCGCDGNTYWNASVAGASLVGVAAVGACAQGKTCGGFGGMQCAAGLYCNYSGLPNICQIADVGGKCWGMPLTCVPDVGFGPQSRACKAAQCEWECELIKKQAVFELDGACPQ